MHSHALARAVEGVQERTVGGAIVTFLALASIALLLLGEVGAFFSPDTVHHLGVDDGDAAVGFNQWAVPDRLPIFLHATFAHVVCDDLELNIEATRGLSDAIDKISFREPTPAELAGWAPEAAVQEGCTLDGRLRVGKVSAHLTVAVRGGGMTGRRLSPLAAALAPQLLAPRELRNVSHRIHAFRFGAASPHAAAPLSGVSVAPPPNSQVHYVLKVIPTVLDGVFGAQRLNQYSLAESVLPAARVAADPSLAPGVAFYYDFFPVMVQVATERTTVPEFLVSLCAIVGGCASLAALVDGFLFKSTKALTGKSD